LKLLKTLLDARRLSEKNDQKPGGGRIQCPRMTGFYAQVNRRFRIEPFFRLLPDEWKEGHFTATVRYEEKDTDIRFITLGDVARLTVGLNFRPITPFVFKNSFHFEKTGAGGTRPHVWSGDFWKENNWEYISSVAYLF
jgi:hypothetical protein